MVSRLNRMLRTRDPAAAAEAEMLVRKHPNSFDALMIAASVYYALGGGSHDEYQLRRSLDLLEKSLTLISQNTDPTVSEQTIYGNIAEIYIMLGESEKGVELLKQHNGGGEFSAYIGLELVTELGRYEEAEPYLTQSMLKNLSSLGDTVFG